ncbi:peptidase M48 family protein [Mycobacterium kansasii]|uniref:Peptidase M48 family protein n=1 Tax=Mycobacterium kansasii TaxID=1768 RepID=A0A1V3X2B5_MYCKA|nr:peptidase M48 family protein [Mycobacterium kansasii]
MNAYTIGMEQPFIVITSALYDLMTHDELRFVVGHELGHALSGHAVYRTMMMHLMRLARSFGVVPVGGWALRAIIAALLEWQRKSELSGDRAGLLCSQDLDTAIRVEMKLAGGGRLDKLDSEAFLAQAREYAHSGDMRDGLLKLLNLELQTHPFSVLRAAALNKWVDTGGYGKVMSGDYPRRADDDKSSFTDDLGQAARHYRDGFDQSDDPLIKGIRDGLGGFVDGVGVPPRARPIRWAAKSTNGGSPNDGWLADRRDVGGFAHPRGEHRHAAHGSPRRRAPVTATTAYG